MNNTGAHDILVDMKQRFAMKICVVAALSALLLSGCSAGGFTLFSTPSPVPSPSPTPSPTPAPTPVPVIAVFGADASLSFAEGVTDYAKGKPYLLAFVPGGVDALLQYRPDGAVAAIVFLEDASVSLPETDIPVFACAADGQNLSSNIQHLSCSDVNAAVDTLNLAISYPPHETPVRMIGLFKSKTSRAYFVWNLAVSAGRVFPKAEFIENKEDQPLSVWLDEQFSAFYPGMLDAIFSETGSFAVTASEMLTKLGRDDLEVFAAASDANADRALSSVLVAVTGTDLHRAGELCCAGAEQLLYGNEATGGSLPPVLLQFSPEP